MITGKLKIAYDSLESPHKATCDGQFLLTATTSQGFLFLGDEMKGSKKTKLDEEAYERDEHKCVECSRTKGIEAHHIIPEVELLDNLVTLCHSCHKKRHNMTGCFKKGKDERREKGIDALSEICKTHYFNNFTMKWVKRKIKRIRKCKCGCGKLTENGRKYVKFHHGNFKA